MLDQIARSGRLSLLARILVVAAIGVAVVDLLNRGGPSFVVRGPDDAVAFVTDQLRALAHVSVALMGLGRDVVEFLGLA